MYGYKNYVELTPQEILNRVKQADIFKIIFKDNINFNKTYCAPYRADNNPSCYFEKVKDIIYFVDFADTRINKNCFFFLQSCFNLSYNEVLLYVNDYFNLGLGFSSHSLKPVRTTVEKIVNLPKVQKVITYAVRKFDVRDKIFWGKYEITKQNLVDDNVLPLSFYRLQSDKPTVNITPYDIAYAYTEFPNNKCKIYRPNADKKIKWITNCNQHDVGSYIHLPLTGKLLYITKSYKDCRVLRNQGLHSVWFQNEGMFPNQNILLDYCKRFNKIIVWFDNDTVGIKNGIYLVDYLNKLCKNKAKLCFLPVNLLDYKIKDPSDCIVKHKKILLEIIESHKNIK